MKRISREIPVDKLTFKQVSLWEVQKKLQERGGEEEFKEPYERGYITISREAGSLGNDVASRLAKNLGWQLYDKEIVDYIATTAHVRKSVIESFDEKKQDEIKTWVQKIIDSEVLSPDRYLGHLMSVILAIAERGRAIILGRGANFILDPERGLRVKISAPLELRIVQIMHDLKLTRKEAQRYLAQRDNQRLAYIRRYFHRDADDPLFYDLVLNTEFMPLDAVVETITTALKTKLGTTASPFSQQNTGTKNKEIPKEAE